MTTDAAQPPLRAEWLRPFLAAFAVGLVVHGALAALMPGFADRDAWFHTRLAQLMISGDAPWNGLSFPWTTQSAYSDRPMDWALGWHWLLAPFTLVGDAGVALRMLITLQAALLTGVFHALVVRRRAAWPWAWTALLTFGCAAWTFRTQMGRPTTLAVALLLVLFAAVVERRRVLAGVVAAAALLVYQVPAAPVLVTLCALAGLAVARRAAPWRTALAVLAGGVAGVVLHPGFWSVGPGGFLSLDHATFHVWELMRGSLAFAQHGGVLETASGRVVVPLPDELAAPVWTTFRAEFAIPLAATVLGVIGLARRRDAWSVGLAAFAVVGLMSTLRSGRFGEYWHPFALLAATTFVTPGTDDAPAGRWRVRLTVLALLLASIPQVMRLTHWMRIRAQDEGDQVRAAATALDDVAQPGDIVWHSQWDEFAPLFHWNPRVRWITGMDPWYLAAHHADGPLLLAQISAGDALFSDDDLRDTFTNFYHARFVLLWRRDAQRFARLEERLRKASWASVVHDDPNAVVFEISPK